MATFHIDPENKTGSAINSAGGGSISSPYVDLDYAVQDINSGGVHSKGSTGDVFKMIGVYAPDNTKAANLTTQLVAYGNGAKIVGDGANGFGTSSPTSMATMSQANCTTPIINSISWHYGTIASFKFTNFRDSTYAISAGQRLNFIGNHCDTSAISGAGSQARIVAGRNAWRAIGNYVKARAATGILFQPYTSHVVGYNYADIDDGNTAKAVSLQLSSTNSGNHFIGNIVYVGGAAQAFRSNSDFIALGNLIVGTSGNGTGIVFGNSGGHAVICGNHFENLYQAFGALSNGSTTSGYITSTDNTYHNVTYVDTPNPDFTRTWNASGCIIARNTNLARSGVVNAATGDLRTSSSRLGKNILNALDLQTAWENKMSSGVNINNPTQYSPFG